MRTERTTVPIGIDTALSYAAAMMRFVESLVVAQALGPVGQGSYAMAKTTSILAAQPLGGSSIAAVNRVSADGGGRGANISGRAMAGIAAGTVAILIPLAIVVINRDVRPSLAVASGTAAVAIAMAIGQARSTMVVLGAKAGYAVHAASTGLFLAFLTLLAVTDRLTPGRAITGLACMYFIDCGIGRFISWRAGGEAMTWVGLGELKSSATIGLLLQMCVNRADIIVLGVVAGPSAAGVYSVALATVQPVQQYGQVLAAREARGVWNASRLSLLVPTRELLLVAAASAVGLYFAIGLLFGDAYAGAIPAMLVLIPAALLQVGQVRMTNYALSIGRERRVEQAELVGLVALIGGTLLLGPVLGPTGAAIASAIAYAARLGRTFQSLAAVGIDD